MGGIVFLSTTISYDDIQKLVHTAKSKRDTALILTNLSGLGVGEILDFNSKWFQIYKVLKSRLPDVRWKAAVKPVRVDLVRHKRNVKFYTMLVDDQIDALADLLDEREAGLVDRSPKTTVSLSHIETSRCQSTESIHALSGTNCLN